MPTLNEQRNLFAPLDQILHEDGLFKFILASIEIADFVLKYAGFGGGIRG